MIEANELRIGNLVNTEDSIVEIENIVDGGINGTWDLEWFKYQESEISEIPLTEEWLIKFGFEFLTIYNDKYRYCKKDDFIIKIINKDVTLLPASYWYNVNFKKDVIEIKYIHQLQNLFFVLIGEELTVQQPVSNSDNII